MLDSECNYDTWEAPSGAGRGCRLGRNISLSKIIYDLLSFVFIIIRRTMLWVSVSYYRNIWVFQCSLFFWEEKLQFLYLFVWTFWPVSDGIGCILFETASTCTEGRYGTRQLFVAAWHFVSAWYFFFGTVKNNKTRKQLQLMMVLILPPV